MSSEYTIDIQLTELGFPDILQPSETHVRQTPCVLASSDASLSHSHSTERKVIRGNQSVVEDPAAVTQNVHIEQTTEISETSQTLPCTPLQPTPSVQDKQAASRGPVDAGAVLPVLPKPSISCPTTELGTTETPLLATEQKIGDAESENGQKDLDDGQEAKGNSTEAKQGVENESDDSEVSVTDEEEEEDDEEEEGLDNESSNSGDYRCSFCELQLPSNLKLQEHMNLHTGARPYRCAECGKRFCQIDNYRAHLRTHAQARLDPLLCRICLTVFKSQEGLRDHLSTTHFEKKFYECDLCKRVFTDLKVCEWHVEWHKRTLGNFVCESCGRIFSLQKSLTRHRNKKCHRSYNCTDCTKSFTRKNALLKHSFSHLGLLPYTCIRCRSHFRLAKLYRQHKCEPQRIHCVACLRVFLSQADFQKHKKDTGCWGHQGPKGDEIRCLECGQSFATAEELKKHAGAHQKVLTCAECGKGFRSALLLMSHMGGHAGQTPCLCQRCGLGFPHQQSYDSHLNNCGHTPHPSSALKKRTATKNSPPPVKRMPQPSTNLSLPTKNPTNTSNTTVTIPADVSNIPAAPVEESGSPKNVTGGASNGSGPAEAVWQLTLDKRPPPGVKLVLFVPVSSSLANGLAFPSTVPQAPPVPDIQVQPHVALPPAPRGELRLHKSSSHLGPSSVPGTRLRLDVPLDLVMGNKQDPDYVAPLDLSKKSTSTVSALTICPLPVKIEPEDPEFSEEARSIQGEAFQRVDSKETILKVKREQWVTSLENTAERDKYTTVKRLKLDPMDLSPLNFSTTSSGLVMDIKKEPQTPGSDFNLLPSKSCQLTAWRPEREMKMEDDGPSPSCPDAHVDPLSLSN
ncbi:uncharacterized protein LOC139913594 [Centroberyx gerrardi]